MKKYKLNINGKEYTVDIESLSEDSVRVTCNGTEYKVEYEEPDKPRKKPAPVTRKTAVPDVSERRTSSPASAATANAVKAPIPGLITQVLVSEGDRVEGGQTVAKMEAMKMENNILASADGKIKKIEVKAGDSVLEGDILMSMEEA
jgi:biotin carboxyl carrier protein